MKQLAIYLLLALMAILVPNNINAQNPDEGEEIEVTITETTSENGLGRGYDSIPFTVTLFRSLFCINVEFCSNIGEMTIKLTNMTTGYISSMIADTQFHSVVVPLSAVPGLWQITFQPEGGGVTYSGTFIL